MKNQFGEFSIWNNSETSVIKEKYHILSKIDMMNLLPNRSWRAIQKRASEIHSLKHPHIKRCELNREFFKTWTNESAYMLGVLEAEGSITYTENGITLGLGKIELEWITNLAKITGSTAKIRSIFGGIFGDHSANKNEISGYTIAFSSKQWVIDMKSLGFRSGSLPKVPDKYMKYFMRGYFDGDGTIFIDADNACYASAFYGHPLEMMEQIRQIIDCDFASAKKNPTCFGTHGHKLATIKLANYFPPHEWYMLKRKSDLLDQALIVNSLHKQERAKILDLVPIMKNKRIRYIHRSDLKLGM